MSQQTLPVLLLASVVVALAGAGPGAVDAEPETVLKQAHVVFRHGARTPTAPYPNDPYANDTYAPYGLGYLTRNGRRNLFHLGKWLRERYVGSLVPSEYSTGIVNLRASAVPRTHESLASALAAMWPPSGAQSWAADESDLGQQWMPIAFETIPANTDKTIAGSATCLARDLAQAAVYQTSEYLGRVEALLGDEAISNIAKYASVDCPSDPSCAMTIYSALRSQEDLNMALPEWSKLVYPEPIRSAANLWLQSLSYTPLLRRLSFGDLTTSLLTACRQHEDAGVAKLHLYSGHDTTVTAALQIFHLEAQEEAARGIAEYGAHLVAELHQDAQGTLGLKFFYSRSYDAPVTSMVVRGCAAFCPLDQLEALIGEELPSGADSCDLSSTAELGRSGLVNYHLKHIRGH